MSATLFEFRQSPEHRQRAARSLVSHILQLTEQFASDQHRRISNTCSIRLEFPDQVQVRSSDKTPDELNYLRQGDITQIQTAAENLLFTAFCEHSFTQRPPDAVIIPHPSLIAKGSIMPYEVVDNLYESSGARQEVSGIERLVATGIGSDRKWYYAEQITTYGLAPNDYEVQLFHLGSLALIRRTSADLLLTTSIDAGRVSLR